MEEEKITEEEQKEIETDLEWADDEEIEWGIIYIQRNIV